MRETPGELVHVDIKKLGRIPDGGGHKVLGRARGKRDRQRGMGYWYIHNAVDDHTRLAYSELLTDERKHTAAGFWQRANAYFNAAGITVQRVLTDNGACYRSKVFADALGPDITHKRTRPYRPQTNGKVCEYVVGPHRARSDSGQGMTVVSCVRFVDRVPVRPFGAISRAAVT